MRHLKPGIWDSFSVARYHYFSWPCANFAGTEVFKIRITILKSMQYVVFLWDFSQIRYNHQSNTNNIYKYFFWTSNLSSSMEFHGIPWNSGVWKKFHGIPLNLDLDKIPRNSMELEFLLLKFHGIPWNHMCCSNVVQKLPWNSGESSMELFDQNKFQWALKDDFELYFDT